MKRSYEFTYIMPATLNEADQKSTEEKVLEWIKGADGEVTNTSHWDRRRLAYNIGTNREGYYVFLEAQLVPETITDIERRVKLEPNVIRHLVVRIDE